MKSSNSDIWIAVFGFLGVFVGALLGLLGVRLQTSSYFRRAKADRDERHLDNQRDRQHTWMVQLQDAISDYQREVVQIHQHNITGHDLDPAMEFGSISLPNEAFQRAARLRAAVEIFNSRIDDPEVRRVVTELLKFDDAATRPVDRVSAVQAFTDSLEFSNIVIRVIGALIRWFDSGALPKTQFRDVTNANVEVASESIAFTTPTDMPGIMAPGYMKKKRRAK